MQTRAATYTISTARSLSESAETYQIGLSKSSWTNAVLGGGLFFLLGLVLLVYGGDSRMMGVVGLGLGAILAFIYPLRAQLTFDYRLRQVQFSARYLLRIPMQAEGQWSFSQVAKVSRERATLGIQRASVLMADGSRFVLDFGKKTDLDQFLQRLEALNRATVQAQPSAVPSFAGTSPVPAGWPQTAAEATVRGNEAVLQPADTARVVEQAQISESQALMQRELRSWSLWLFIFGILQMVTAKGFSPWGSLLILVGLAALYFREAPMFIVFAATIAWAGINNMFTGQVQWIIFAVFQAIIVVQILRQFRRFHRAQTAEAAEQPPSRTRQLFPWLSLTLGGGGLMGFALVFITIFVFVVAEQTQMIVGIMRYVEIGMVYTAILGIATGAASLASGFPRKAASIIGCVAGGLTVLIELIFALLG